MLGTPGADWRRHDPWYWQQRHQYGLHCLDSTASGSIVLVVAFKRQADGTVTKGMNYWRQSMPKYWRESRRQAELLARQQDKQPIVYKYAAEVRSP
jgi:hypothetical protein